MNSNRGSALVLFLTGLGTGIALATLLAPRSGPATRRLIGRKVEAGTDWMKDKAGAAQEYVQCQGKQLQELVKDATEAVGRS